ncbi:MAG: SsrA-binding protein SmpB [Caldisericaceae bacterium]
MEEQRVIATNKRTLRDFEIIDSYEAGVELEGFEVKSIRAGRTSIEGSYIKESNGELFIYKMFVAANPSAHSSISEKRKRKLLLHRYEIIRLSSKVKERGFTILPIDVHTSGNRIKLNIALARHKKLYGGKEKIESKRITEETRNLRRSFR